MTPKLTSEQRDALHRSPGPVLVEDDETHHLYFLVDPDTLRNLQEQEDLAALIKGAAEADAGQTIPFDEAFRRIEASLNARFSQ